MHPVLHLQCRSPLLRQNLLCRDARAITSHAQKFFIKLAIAGKQLPPRVAETGKTAPRWSTAIHVPAASLCSLHDRPLIRRRKNHFFKNYTLLCGDTT